MLYLLILLFSVLLLGTVYVGPFSVRVYATILMTLILYQNRSQVFLRFKPLKSSLFKTYLVFLFVMGLSLLFSGDLIPYNFPKKILAYYFVCIICYLGIYAFVTEKKDINRVCILLNIILCFNSIVTILQYTGSSLGWLIGNFFEDLSNDQSFIDSHGGDALGYSRVPGIFGSTVVNAFMIVVLAPLSLYSNLSTKNKFVSSFWILPYFLGFIACFMTQQRAAFALYVVSLAIFLINNFRRKPWLLFMFIIIFCFVFSDVIHIIENIDYGRLLDRNNSNRDVLTEQAIDFISNNFFFGGPIGYSKLAGLDSAHNLLYDSWITAGLGGFILMVVLYLKSLKMSLLCLCKSFVKKNDTFYIVLSFFISMIYGLVHNTSYLSGDCIILILLAIVELASQIDDSNDRLASTQLSR